jgi:hypothetical protein
MPHPIKQSTILQIPADHGGGLRIGHEEAPNNSNCAHTSDEPLAYIDDLTELGLSDPEEYYRSSSEISPNQAPGGDAKIGGMAHEGFDIVDELYVFLTQDEVCADVIPQLEPKYWKV